MPTVLEKVVFGALRAPSYGLEAATVEDVTPHLRRVRFAAPDLLVGHEVTPGFWIRLWFPCDGDEYQHAYTVTDIRDDGTFAVDFVLHDGPGLASGWARSATAGQRLRATVLGSKRFAVPDPPPAGYLLVGDAASRPAINEILQALPAGVPANVMLEYVHDDELTVPISIRPGDRLARVSTPRDLWSACARNPIMAECPLWNQFAALLPERSPRRPPRRWRRSWAARPAWPW